MPERGLPPDSDFDLRTRAALNRAFEPGAPPASLLRKAPPLWTRRGFQRGALALLLTGGGAGVAMAQRPPSLVRHAIDHEYLERSLRGSLMEPAQMLERIGMRGARQLPGFVQLLRPCDLDGHLAYHLTTFFEKSGMVTLFAFDQPVDLRDGEGWWNNIFWQVLRSQDQQPLVLLARQRKTLAMAEAALHGGTAVAPG